MLVLSISMGLHIIKQKLSNITCQWVSGKQKKGPCQVLLNLEQPVHSVGMATLRHKFHASFVWGLASLQPSAQSSTLAKCLVNLSH